MNSKEPPKCDELIQHPMFICTPHLGASSIEAQNRVAIDIAEQIVKFVKDNKLEGGVSLFKTFCFDIFYLDYLPLIRLMSTS